MEEMTSRERFARMYAHEEADRVPIIDSPWGATIERWQSEGMPEDVSYVDFFGLDHVHMFNKGGNLRPGQFIETIQAVPEMGLEERHGYITQLN